MAMTGLKRRAKKVKKADQKLTPRQERERLKRLLKLKEEFGPDDPGPQPGSSG